MTPKLIVCFLLLACIGAPATGAAQQPVPASQNVDTGPSLPDILKWMGISLRLPADWQIKDAGPPDEDVSALFGPAKFDRETFTSIAVSSEPAKGRALTRFVADVQKRELSRATISASRPLKICNGTQNGWLTEAREQEEPFTMSMMAIIAINGKRGALVLYMHRADSPEDPQLRKAVEATCLL